MAIMRLGKTLKDHARGVHGNRFANRQARVAWQKDNNANGTNFPTDSSNGKKSQRIKKSIGKKKK